MRIKTLFVILLFLTGNVSNSITAQGAWGKVIAIGEGIKLLWDIYQELSTETSMLVFRTDSYNPINIEVNGDYIGKISRGQVLSVEVEAGMGYYKAFHKDGKVYFNELYLSGNTKHEIKVSAANSVLSTPEYAKYGWVNGDRVNLRDQPSTSGQQLGQLSSRTRVQILDQITYPAKDTDFITVRKAKFYGQDKSYKFDINRNYAVNLVSSTYDGWSLIWFRNNYGKIERGYMRTSDLQKLSNTWYKVRVGSYVGYIYGKLINQAA